MERADWREAEKEYIETEISLYALSKKLGLPRSTLYKRARREHWVERRELYREEQTPRRSPPAQRRAETGENPDALLRVTDKLLRRAEEIADSGDEIGTKELGELMRALKSASTIKLAHAPETEQSTAESALTIRFSPETEEAAR